MRNDKEKRVTSVHSWIVSMALAIVATTANIGNANGAGGNENIPPQNWSFDGIFGMFDYFSSDTSVLSEIALEYFNEQADIKRYQGVTVGVMGGAISYFKIKEDIRAAVNIMPGVGVMSKKITLQDGTTRDFDSTVTPLDIAGDDLLQ